MHTFSISSLSRTKAFKSYGQNVVHYARKRLRTLQVLDFIRCNKEQFSTTSTFLSFTTSSNFTFTISIGTGEGIVTTSIFLFGCLVLTPDGSSPVVTYPYTLTQACQGPLMICGKSSPDRHKPLERPHMSSQEVPDIVKLH